MITINKHLTISGGKAPYSYTWQASSSCVTIPQINGTTSSSISTSIQFADTNCINNATLSLIIEDAEGCTITLPVTFDNPCIAYSASPIVRTGSLNTHFLSISPYGGLTPYTYTWTWDTSQYRLVSGENATSNVLKIERIDPNSTGSNSYVSVTITDANGCSIQRTYLLRACLAITNSFSTTVGCSIRGGYADKLVDLATYTSSNCAGINWDTLQLQIPSGITYNHLGNGQVLFTFSSSISGLQNVSWRVAPASGGVYSEWGIVSFILQEDCSEFPDDPIVAGNRIIQLPEDVTTTSYTYDINNGATKYVYAVNEIDWDTFEFLSIPGQTANGKELNIAGIGTLNLSYDGQFILSISTLPNPTVAIPVHWRVKDSLGQWSNTAVWIFNFNVFSTPSASNRSQCAECGEASPFFNIIGSISDPNLRSSLEIVTEPTLGTLNINSDSDVSYILDPNQVGSTDTYQYRFRNTDHVWSNTGTVTINRYCAGVSSGDIDISCANTLTFNLDDNLTGLKSTGTWSELPDQYSAYPYTANGGTITGGTAGTVNFTGIPYGTFAFRKTVNAGAGDDNCPITNSVDVNVSYLRVPQVSNDLCAGAIQLNYITTSFTDSILSNQTNESICPTRQAPTDSGVALPASWDPTSSGDMWYKFSTGASTVDTPYITMYGNNIYAPQIALYSGACNSLVLEDDAAANSNEQFIVLNPTVAPSTTYWIRVSTGGTTNAGPFSISITVNPVL